MDLEVVDPATWPAFPRVVLHAHEHAEQHVAGDHDDGDDPRVARELESRHSLKKSGCAGRRNMSPSCHPERSAPDECLTPIEAPQWDRPASPATPERTTPRARSRRAGPPSRR